MSSGILAPTKYSSGHPAGHPKLLQLETPLHPLKHLSPLDEIEHCRSGWPAERVSDSLKVRGEDVTWCHGDRFQQASFNHGHNTDVWLCCRHARPSPTLDRCLSTGMRLLLPLLRQIYQILTTLGRS